MIPLKIRKTKTNVPSPLRIVLHRSSQTTPEMSVSVSGPPTSRAVTFEPFAIPKQKGLVWGIATPTETPLQSGGQMSVSLDKPLPGLPTQQLGALPRAKSELHLERTTRGKSYQSLPELSTIIEEDRPNITSSKTVPAYSASLQLQEYSPTLDHGAVQADPLAFMPILVPTKAPLRGWSPEDLDCPEMTSSNSSLASSRTASVVTTPLPTWEAESSYPFPLVKLAGDDDEYASMDDNTILSTTFSMKHSRAPSGHERRGGHKLQPAIREVGDELGNALSLSLDGKNQNQRLSKVVQDQRTTSKPTLERSHTQEPKAVRVGNSKPKPSIAGQALLLSTGLGADRKKSSQSRVPVPSLLESSVSQPKRNGPTVCSPQGKASSGQEGLISGRNNPIAADLFTHATPESNITSYEKGRQEAEKIAKEFWNKHKVATSGGAEKPPIKVMLETLFYTAPADLRPCPERLRFLGIRR